MAFLQSGIDIYPYTLPVGDVIYVGPSNSNYVGSAPLGSSTATRAQAINNPSLPLTLDRAMAVSNVASDVIVILGGYYREFFAIYKSRKVFPQQGQAVTVSAFDVHAGSTFTPQSGKYVKSIPYTFTPYSILEEYQGSPAEPYIHRVAVYVEGVRQTPVTSVSAVTAGKYFYDTAAGKLYVPSNTLTYEVTARDRAIAVSGAGSELYNVGAIGGATSAISIGAQNVKLQYCGAEYGSERGVRPFGGSHGYEVVGCDITGNAHQGLAGSQTNNAHIHDNYFSDNNYAGFNNWSAGDVKLSESVGSIVEDNYIQASKCAGIWLDVSCADCEVTYNTLLDGTRAAIFVEISENNIVAGNYISNYGWAGVLLSNAAATRLFNNTIRDCNAAIQVKDSGRGVTSTDPRKDLTQYKWRSVDNIIINNVLVGGLGADDYIYETTPYGSQDTKDMVKTFKNNFIRRYSDANNPTYIAKYKNGSVWTAATTYAAFTAAADTEVADNIFREYTQGVSDVYTSQYAADRYIDVLTPVAGGVLDGAGLALSADSAAAFGVTAGVATDIGAIQI